MHISPNFFVVGAQKSGTTALHTYLSFHPQIYLPSQKETKFFVDDARYSQGIDYYITTYFSDWQGQQAVGEVDPEYMYFDCALPRIEKSFDIKKLRFIFILRHPVDRAFSHYLMSFRRGLEFLSFEEAWEQEVQRIQRDYRSKLHFSYISRGLYFRQIERFLQRVDKSQLLFLLSEDLERNPEECIRRCVRFLGVSENYICPTANERVHQAKVPRSVFLMRRVHQESFEKKLLRLMLPSKRLRSRLREKILKINETQSIHIKLSSETRQKLISFYQEENTRLSKLLNRDLSAWNK